MLTVLPMGEMFRWPDAKLNNIYTDVKKTYYTSMNLQIWTC